MSVKYTQEIFEKKVKEIHGDEIDISNFKYVNSLTSGECYCNKCGRKWKTRADVILRGCGCPSCSKGNYQRLSFEEVCSRINKKLTLIKDSYIDTKHKCETKCNICGHIWHPKINDLFRGHGCPNCAHKDRFKEKEEAINEIALKNSDFDFSESEYLGCRSSVTAKCKKCGRIVTYNYNFWQQGCCIKCICSEEYKTSVLERVIKNSLIENQIEFSKNNRKILGGLELDFYIPSKNIAIECQGRQHFEPSSFGCTNKKIVEENFVKQQQRDISKKQKCQDQGIKLIYFLDKEYNGFMTENDTYFNNTDDLLKYINNF